MDPTFPPRLHVLLARGADVGLVIRRGPTGRVCTLKWDLRRDTFEVGQWLSARIYERRSDLSSDGKYFIYFALSGRWSSETGGSWTAISRAPYVKALVLLGKGDGWHGGGLFTGPRTYWLNDGYGHRELRTSTEVTRDTSYRPAASYGGECPGVYYLRLQRDGWANVDHIEAGELESCTIFEKKLPGGWILRKLAHEQVGAPPGKGCYWDEHELQRGPSGPPKAFPDWEWCELEGRSLVFAERGVLYRAPLSTEHGIGEPKALQDFAELEFEAIEAPY